LYVEEDSKEAYMQETDSTKALEDLLKRVYKENRKALIPIFKRHGIDPGDGVKTLVREICLDGSNTIASFFRGRRGVDYRTVVLDVAEKLKVDYESVLDAHEDDIFFENAEDDPIEWSEASETVALESAIIQKIILKHIEESTKKGSDIRQVLNKVGIDFNEFIGTISNQASSKLIRSIGRKAYNKILIAVIGRTLLSITGKRVGTVGLRMVGLSVPVLNVLFAGWLILDVAGPSYRKTIPTVIDLAILRLNEDAEE
jgi:uncharacterized protein YaaW (UPF0174 family)